MPSGIPEVSCDKHENYLPELSFTSVRFGLDAEGVFTSRLGNFFLCTIRTSL